MDDNFKILGTLFILLLGAMIFIMLLSGSGGEVNCNGPNEVPCDDSPCGCCVVEGNELDPCAACGDSNTQYILVDGKCCASDDLNNCIGGGNICVNPDSCSSNLDCCSGFECSDGQCAPCNVGLSCDPLNPNSCCNDMYCSSSGYCLSCSEQSCSVDSDCCDDYYCNDGNCLSCSHTCDAQTDCCDGWECQNGECVKCVEQCDDGICPCSGYQCMDGQCVGCDQGAFCDADHPCCDGYECDLTTNRCLECDNRACSSDADCCDGFTCDSDRGVCYSSESCVGHPCTNPGEPCSVCEGDNCQQCTDNSICAYDELTQSFVCKSSCPDGSVVCDAKECSTGCCDPLTGECAGCVEGYPCENVNGCGCCEVEGYEVEVCPVGGYLYLPESTSPFPRRASNGCTLPSMQNEFVGFASCPDLTHDCSKYEGACCSYVVPADGIPNGVREVSYNTCASGFQDLSGNCCALKVLGPNSAGVYKYAFDCNGQDYVEISNIAPYERIVYGSKLLNIDPDQLSAICNSHGYTLSECLKKPVKVYVR